MDQQTNDEGYNPETAKVVMELATKEYSNENDRNKSIDTKTGPMIAATGAAMLFVAGIFSRPPQDLPPFWAGVYFSGVCLVLACLLTAQVFFFQVLRTRRFGRVKVASWTDEATLRDEPERIRGQLASTYEKAIAANSAINETKARNHDVGLMLLTVAIVLLAFVLVASQIVPELIQ